MSKNLMKILNKKKFIADWEKNILSTPQLSKKYKISRSTIYALKKELKLKNRPDGRKKRISIR